MLQLLHSETLWDRVGRVRGRGTVTVAIAYANEDHLKLRAGDTLICDASDGRIASGATSHALLSVLAARDVSLWSLGKLHAKVVRLPKHAVVGSANMTSNSKSLVEASMMTDDPTMLRQVDALLSQLHKDKRIRRIDASFLERIKAIPVVRSGGGGNRSRSAPVHRPAVTWLMGYRALSASERTKSDPVVAKLINEEEPRPYFRRTLKVARERPAIHVDDTLIFVDLRERRVHRPVTVTGVESSDDHRFYMHEETPAGGIAWKRVQAKLQAAGVRNRVTVPDQFPLDAEAESIVSRMFRPSGK